MPLSCPHEENMRCLDVPKLTLYYVCMKLLVLVRSKREFCCHKSHEGKNSSIFYKFPSPRDEQN